MRIVAPLVLAGTALFATGIAAAATHHVMRVPLSDGAVGTIEYEGDVAPRVTIIPIAAAKTAAASAAAADPFAQMDAMFAAMAQRHAAMMRELAALQAQAEAQTDPASPLRQAAIGEGGRAGGYSFVSTTTTSSGGCGHSVQIIQQPGAAPQRVERSFGNCAAQQSAPAPRAPQPSAAPAPATPTV